MANESNNASPLDSAVESVKRDELDEAPPVADNGGDAFSLTPDAPSAEPKRRGRPPNPNGRAARRARAKADKTGTGAAASGVVSDPPVPPLRAEYPKIAPESVAESIKQIDALLVKAFGTTPLSTEEATGGGAVFAPVLDHYMPLMAEKGGLWIAPLTWVILAYGPRAYEVLDRQQKAKEAKRNGWTAGAGAQSGDNNGARTFQPVASENSR